MNRVEIPPTREFCAPSERFFSAMQRYAGGAEGHPPVSVIGDNQMQDVMRAQELIPSQVYYFEFNENHGSDNGTGHDGDTITGVNNGKAAGEFIRTSDYGITDINRTVEIKEGRGVVLVQKNTTGPNGTLIPNLVEKFEAIRVTKGQEVVVPSGSFYALVNTDRNNILVVKHSGHSKENSSSGHSNSQPLKDMQGFAYRVVAADSHVCLQLNGSYEQVKDFKNGGIPLFGENLD